MSTWGWVRGRLTPCSCDLVRVDLEVVRFEDFEEELLPEVSEGSRMWSGME